ncbi:MAG: putative cytochrome P450 137 [Chroococcidiopsis cubana SAG 39.79]|uniref:Cytochrome P450 n=1 Tax=Chroococcidiopsis cubana SAG 39.79 TaxID=388085 RepID=A0AB37U8X7_9CYAN|nr:cytochrome P450 [Chroococcidiopsis cubana]MDZ4877622.1 putative cytochrome P450 137 [Chroococcidiopsis cubana SAG 39.79]PSB62128.1 cytochrome P450 [Chroococcidiopsis cubana CCALA 043]RUT00886.1 cytochrome P450 [Chroococcidiopsis cubana SAG 39.79]
MISKPRFPDGSPAPRWLQKIQYAQNSIAYMDAAQRYGDIFNAPVIGDRDVVLFISNPQALQHIFANDTKQFIAPPNQHVQPLAGDYSLFTLSGSRHRRERRLLMPPFHGERMQTYGQLICERVDKSMRKLSIGTRFSARELAQEISLEVILKVVFGIHQEDRFNHLKSLLVHFTDSLQSPFIGGLLLFPSLQKDWGTRSPWGYLRSLQRQIGELVYAEIRVKRSYLEENRRNHNQMLGSDILSLMISARDETGQPMTDIELHDELITLSIAGQDTTASAIAWALYAIHRHPQVGEKLEEELNRLGSPDPTSIVQLPYLTAVCHESLRLFPVAVLTNPREVNEPVELMGYNLEPGIRLYGCIYLTHQRPDIYLEPKLFKPERFLERQFSRYEFLPFGGGVRRCIGEALALFKMKLVLATMLSRYRLALADREPEYPVRRGVSFAPARGVQMILEEKL